MSPRLLGTVTAWYSEQGKGFIQRSIHEVKPPKGMPATAGYKVEHYSFAAQDVIQEDGRASSLTEGSAVLFELLGRDSCGRWAAGRVHVLRDNELATAVDGAVGMSASTMHGFGADTTTAKLGAAKRKRAAAVAGEAVEAGEAAGEAGVQEMTLQALMPEGTDPKLLKRLQRFVDAFEEADDDSKLSQVQEIGQRLEEATALLDYDSVLSTMQQAAVCLEQPQDAGAEEAQSPAQRLLRKALLVSLRCFQDAEAASRSLAEPIMHMLRRLITASEIKMGKSASEAQGGKQWARMKELLGMDPAAAAVPETAKPEEAKPKAKRQKKAAAAAAAA